MLDWISGFRSVSLDQFTRSKLGTVTISSSSQSQQRGLRDDAKEREGCGVAGGSSCLIADLVVAVLGGVPARSVQIRRRVCGAGWKAANHALVRRSSSCALHGDVSIWTMLV